MTQATRHYIYGIVAAAIPLLVLLGVITGDVAQEVLNIAAAVLGVGAAALALPNSNPKRVDVIPRGDQNPDA